VGGGRPDTIRAAFARLVAWQPARTTLIATCALVGFTYAVVGAAAPRLSDAERPVAAALLTGPHALDSVVVVVVIFGGPLAAALAGTLAAIEMGSGRAPRGAPRPASPTSLLRTFVALAGLLLAGFGLASAGGLGALLLGSWLAGGSPASYLDPAVAAGLPGQVLRGWWAVVTFAAVGYAAGALTGRRLAGLAVVGGVLIVELLVGLADPTSPLLGLAPISRLGDLAGAGAPASIAPALVVTTAAIVGMLGLALAARRGARSDHPPG